MTARCRAETRALDGVQKKRRTSLAAHFSLLHVPTKRPPPPTPTAHDIRVERPTPSPAPPRVAAKLRPRLVMGIDIETNDWDDTRGNKGSIGQFGFYNLCKPEDLAARVVQLGWAVGGVDGSSPDVKESLIRPDGFVVSAKAEDYHGISHSRAEAEGRALKTVMSEFMADMQDVQSRGGRVVCHHLEFDAGIIDNELSRCGLEHLRPEWATAVRKGCCTMCPEIGRWVRGCFGRDTGPPTAKNTMRLKELAGWLIPGSAELLAKHHTAGADAELHLLLYGELSRIAAAASE